MPLITTQISISDPDSLVPTVTDWDTVIPALTGLLAWCPARANNVSLDGSNTCIQLLDLSGNDGHFDQTSTAADRPLWQADQINGHGAITFDSGTAEWMEWLGSFPVSADFSLVVLTRPHSASAGTTRNLLSMTTSEKHVLFASTDDTFRNNVGTTNTTNAETAEAEHDEWNLVIASFDDSAESAKISLNNGTPVTDTEAGAVTDQAQLFLGAGSASANGPYDGDVACVMVFSNDILASGNSAILASVIAYFEDSFGLSLT